MSLNGIQVETGLEKNLNNILQSINSLRSNPIDVNIVGAGKALEVFPSTGAKFNVNVTNKHLVAQILGVVQTEVQGEVRARVANQIAATLNISASELNGLLNDQEVFDSETN